MNQKEWEQQMIERYQDDEQMMIVIFAQWCVNRGLDPLQVYRDAYPEQGDNAALAAAVQQTVAPAQGDDISDDLLFSVLGLFGNDRLSEHCTALIDSLRSAASKGADEAE
ncbi:hypothetical protein [Paenibacillus sp. 1P07SE]|uniref:hypothetical protein n=1 Tax=Paenibacillus sp. 1P07SE TaxID=3132209 RepID=UPI0039A46DF6